ncbi:Lactonase, 7-bladed beta-propeller-domain-containing protein [Xylariaceae sp. FL0016]|nr:Lactonase, 7-bladed beta-propeller-domain-containing protein [Xylariaceae sp. FL0016]
MRSNTQFFPMPRSYGMITLAVTGYILLVQAAKHRLVVGTFSTYALYTFEYDDEAQSLVRLASNPVPAASSWITMNHDKTKLYGTDWQALEPSFVSYDVTDPLDIKHEATIVAGAGCLGSLSIFVVANPSPPYAVYGSYYYGDAKCSTVMSVNDNGTLDGIVQNYTYANGSAAHGLAFSTDGKYLFSADTKGNSIWTHEIDPETGAVSYFSILPGTEAGADPRHLVAHPSGEYMHAVLEGSSEIAEYVFSEEGKPALQTTYPLLRPGDDAADFWADEVAISATRKYLWGTNRAHDDARKGYISAFRLDGSGAIVEQMYLKETDTSGGYANSVAPAPFADDIAALTDNSTGFVQIWDVGGSVVTTLEMDDGGGCCANVVWLD